ncbi:hypothetical protein WMY93_005803 [Mugilogobius chulae]|uniref:Uncharacterized protein n=1 Tax=Mugilogobius chulae TaxID=88201 RepID=A0AAW0PHU4_9GOBI
MLSELDLEDVEALHSGTSFLTADTLGPLLDHCDVLFGLSSLEEPLSPSSPVHSHHAPLPEAKASDLMLPWLGASDLLDMECPQEEDDALLAMEWVSEKLELNELDLDSLLDSSDDSPECPDSPSPEPSPCPKPEPSPCPKPEPSPCPKPEASSPESCAVAVVKSEPQEPADTPGRSHTDSDSDSGIDSSPPHSPQSCRSAASSPPHSPQSCRSAASSPPHSPQSCRSAASSPPHSPQSCRSAASSPPHTLKPLRAPEPNPTAGPSSTPNPRVPPSP